MPKIDFPIVGAYDILRSVEYDSQDTVNFYIENDPGAKKAQSLQPFPGTEALFSLNTNQPIRKNGLFVLKPYVYAVSGNGVYRFNDGFSPQLIGSLVTYTGIIEWSNSPTEIAIVDGSGLYSYNTQTGVFQKITAIQAIGFPSSPQMIYYQDAKFILSFANSAQYFYSGFADVTSGALEKWDANNFFVQQSRPDLSVGISGTNERLFLFGNNTVETWIPFLTPNLLPFYRDNNFIYEFGEAAIGSIVKGTMDCRDGEPVTNFVYWGTSNPQGTGCFVMSAGGNTVKVSTTAIDIRLSKLTNFSDCISTLYKTAGHVFIENTWEQDNLTLIFDLKTRQWTRKERLNGDRSIINSHAFLFGKHFIGTGNDDVIYEMSDDVATENGSHIRHSRSSMTFIDPMYRRLTGNMFEVDFETGVVPDGLNPVAYLSVSYDGGRSYGYAIPQEMGRIGEYQWKAFWMELGIAHSFTFKVEVYEPIKVFIFGAMFDYDGSTE